jgi:hypothetical protein
MVEFETDRTRKNPHRCGKVLDSGRALGVLSMPLQSIGPWAEPMAHSEQ